MRLQVERLADSAGFAEGADELSQFVVRSIHGDEPVRPLAAEVRGLGVSAAPKSSGVCSGKE